MTTWLEIANGDIDQDSPVTQPLMTGLRDNVRAAAEGSSGAPVLSAGWHPYDKADTDGVEVGDVYDFSDDGVVATVTSPDFEDGYEYSFLFEGIGHNQVSTNDLQCGLYGETDAAFFANQTIGTAVGIGVAATGLLLVPFPRLSKQLHPVKWDLNFGINGADYSAAVTFQDATVQPILRARFAFASGSFASGTIKMLRRREYVSG